MAGLTTMLVVVVVVGERPRRVGWGGVSKTYKRLCWSREGRPGSTNKPPECTSGVTSAGATVTVTAEAGEAKPFLVFVGSKGWRTTRPDRYLDGVGSILR